ncbi:hypothetical protein ABU614_01240 [Lysobacter firmicutimachus]|uniref:Uncharacterized protein n=1 Tax=Lysobacter firmicutimachus TaxID=1792846 RepID=A0AAU8MUT3_9GAMM
MTLGDSSPASTVSFPWPLTFDEFSFGVRCYNTLASNILFMDHQFALDDEVDGPSGSPVSSEWKDRWMAGFIVGPETMPPGPVEIRWTSLDGVSHHAEVDLIGDIFPTREVRHNVPKEDVNEEWAHFEHGKVGAPQILMEINDRTVSVYMKAHVLTKSFPIPGRTDVRSRLDLILVWSKTY